MKFLKLDIQHSGCSNFESLTISNSDGNLNSNPYFDTDENVLKEVEII